MPTPAWGFTGFTLAAIEDDDYDESTIPLFLYWKDIPGAEIGWADFAPLMSYPVPDANGVYQWQGALHKESLRAERIRVEIEARVAGPDPLIDADFGFDPLVVTKPSGQKNLGDGWYLQTFTVIRPVEGQPIGPQYDVLTYLARDVEVRLFRIIDLGPVGDVTLDQQVDAADLALVAERASTSGDLEVEDGDTNMDGIVDTQDVITVIQGIGSP